MQVGYQVLHNKVLLPHVPGNDVHGHGGRRHHEGGAEHDPDVGGRHLVDAAQVRHAPEVLQQVEHGVVVRRGHLLQRALHRLTLLLDVECVNLDIDTFGKPECLRVFCVKESTSDKIEKKTPGCLVS